MTTDTRLLIERLRRGVTWSDGKPIEAVVGAVNDPHMAEAADLIQKQQALITKAVEALSRARGALTLLNSEQPCAVHFCDNEIEHVDSALSALRVGLAG